MQGRAFECNLELTLDDFHFLDDFILIWYFYLATWFKDRPAEATPCHYARY